MDLCLEIAAAAEPSASAFAADLASLVAFDLASWALTKIIDHKTNFQTSR